MTKQLTFRSAQKLIVAALVMTLTACGSSDSGRNDITQSEGVTINDPEHQNDSSGGGNTQNPPSWQADNRSSIVGLWDRSEDSGVDSYLEITPNALWVGWYQAPDRNCFERQAYNIEYQPENGGYFMDLINPDGNGLTYFGSEIIRDGNVLVLLMPFQDLDSYLPSTRLPLITNFTSTDFNICA